MKTTDKIRLAVFAASVLYVAVFCGAFGAGAAHFLDRCVTGAAGLALTTFERCFIHVYQLHPITFPQVPVHHPN